MPRNKATGRTFEIRTLEDFLDVPVRRRAAMLRDFRRFIDLASATRTFMEAMKVQYETQSFRWTDDGDPGVSLDLEAVESNASEVPSDG